MENYSEAFENAQKTIQLAPTFAKGYSRAGIALYKLGRLEEALKHYEEGCKVEKHAPYDVFQREINRINYELRRKSKKPLVLEGTWVAIITPFKEDKSVDYAMFDQNFFEISTKFLNFFFRVGELVDFYAENGVHGILALSLSAEIFQLKDEEKLKLAETIFDRANFRVPVYACGTFGGTLEEQAKFVEKMYETGVEAVVVLPNQIVTKEDSEEIFKNNLSKLCELTGNIPLGVYDCPLPFHKTIYPSKNFFFFDVLKVIFEKKKRSFELDCLFGQISFLY